ncbi:DUF3089 domain-containing protein [Azospirillum sp. B4]|uniref:DUF3089 domain-containing protein n=1 Tax=Azospirillum sp. B4 TaxID=95605 RepID=UPI000347A8B4|nr:DUF3089 domain-containing protein [Azospirillum sp. B4]
MMIPPARLLVLALALGLALPVAPATAADTGVQPFAEQAPPPAPDYDRPESWAARPGAPGAAIAVPPGASPAAGVTDPSGVDVFYVHPTTYRSRERWNQDVADATVNAWTDASVIARQASVFNACCRVFAPRYRQGSSLAFSTMAGDGAKAFDLAYGDVERAFDHYIAHDNGGRPFILAGHSQGAVHLTRLLERRIDGTPLARQLVAAYTIGTNLSEGDFPRTYKTLAVCATPAATHCVIAWNAVMPDADIALFAKAGEARYVQRHGDHPGKTLLCVNPLTFDRGTPAATVDLSQGAVPGEPGQGPLQPLRPHAVSARCDRGYLVVEPAADLGLKPLPGGLMHYHDYGLFYADIRANVTRRIQAFKAGD